MRRGNAFGRSYLCVCMFVCPVRSLTFESLDIETSFWYVGTFSENIGQGQGQAHMSKEM